MAVKKVKLKIPATAIIDTQKHTILIKYGKVPMIQLPNDRVMELRLVGHTQTYTPSN